MSWINRLQPVIEMRSPNGNIFTPKWIGNERSREKKLGLFTYPDVAGTVPQDLNVNSTKWPLTVYFDNSDHDIEGERFFEATAETGTWTVQHPVKGTLVLQLVSVTEAVQPVTSGNVTAFTIQFIEPADVEVIKSKLELRNLAVTAGLNSRSSVLQQFADQVSDVAGNARTAVNTATKKVKTAMNSVLGPLAQIDDAVNSSFKSIDRAIDDTLTQATLFPEELGGQLQNLAILPAQIAVSSTQKLNNYGNLIIEIFKVDGDTKETFAVKDLVLSACVVAVSNISSTSDAKTKAEAIIQVEKVSKFFDDITNELDKDQALVPTTKIEDQYISQEGSYPQNLLTASFAIDYLLRFSFDLGIEKRFTLKENRLPIMITIDEYGTDLFLDFFNETNKLSRSQFLLLPPGFEVVVFPGAIL